MATRNAAAASKKVVAKKKSASKPAPQRAAPKKTSAGTPGDEPVADSGNSGVADITWQPEGAEVGIRVRMYRVGFGDFFLVSFLAAKGDPIHIIIDCGVFKGTSQTGDLGSIEAAVADMAAVTKKQVALIVVTHRHADHIAGFARCAPIFASLKVQAIWMSAWESEYQTAQKFQKALVQTATQLHASFSSMGVKATKEQATARKFMENAIGEGGGGSNAKALDLLKGKINGIMPNYYQAGSQPDLPPAFVTAEIAAKILGPPPIADIQLMKLMDLTKGVGQYLAMARNTESPMGSPFGSKWIVDPSDTYSPMAFREWLPNRATANEPGDDVAAAARKVMQKATDLARPDAALVAATQLNSFLNNQSLVVLFTFKGKNLLFVGDAQAGNWEHWIYGTDAPDKKASGTMTDDAQEILSNLDFYKVGHHGSSNATPIPVVKMMSKNANKFPAMCSTQKDVYGQENPTDPSVGTEVPRIPLLTNLGAVTTLVRSDQLPITVDTVKMPAAVDVPIPAAGGPGRFKAGPLWIDCFL